MKVDELYVLARSVLLDALEALDEHRDAIVLVGAQAVYLRVGEGDLAVAPFTTDADLAIERAVLSRVPPPGRAKASRWRSGPPVRSAMPMRSSGLAKPSRGIFSRLSPDLAWSSRSYSSVRTRPASLQASSSGRRRPEKTSLRRAMTAPVRGSRAPAPSAP